MAPRNPRSQEDVLYEGSITYDRQVDHEFIRQLCKFSEGRLQPLRSTERNIIGASIEVVNRKCHANFSIDEGVHWFKRLEKRHRAFGFALNVEGVRYDPRRNTICTTPPLWDLIYVRYNIAEAYMVVGEPEWLGLQKFFGPPMVLEPADYPKIITISDDSVELINPNNRRDSSRPSSFANQSTKQSTHQSLGTSFWNCLDPIQQDIGLGSQESTGRFQHGDEASRQNTHSRTFNYGPFAREVKVAPDSFDNEENKDHGDDPFGSQASTSATLNRDV